MNSSRIESCPEPKTFTVFAVYQDTLAPHTFIVRGYGPHEAILRILMEECADDEGEGRPIIIAGILEGEHVSLSLDLIH